jgi:hypothetical protein
MKSKTKVINPSYRPPNNPLKLFNAKIPVNQLVVGSIPTAGAIKINTLAVLRGVFLLFGQTYS